MKVVKLRERLFALYSPGGTYLLNTFPFVVYQISGQPNPEELLSLAANCVFPDQQSAEYVGYFNLELIVTTRCNLACKYCHVREGGGYYGFAPEHMSEDVWKAALEFSAEYIEAKVIETGTTEEVDFDLYYLGGEPLLNFEAVQQSFLYAHTLLDAISKKHGVKFTVNPAISTNGVLLNESSVEFLAQHGFEVSITIDGLHHDEHRVYPDGRGTLGDILDRFALFRKLNYNKVKLFSVIPPGYETKIGEIVEFYRERELLSGAYRVSIVPRAITREDVARGCSVPKSCFEAPSTAYQTSSEHYINEFARQLEFIFEHYHIDDRNLFKKITGLAEKGGLGIRCPAALWKFSIVPDGTIWPCHQLVNVDGFRMGNILAHQSLPDSFRQVQQAFRDRVVWEIEPCKDCVLQTLCPPLVDCPARSFIEEGDINRAPGVYCAIYRPYLLNRLGDLLTEMSLGEE